MARFVFPPETTAVLGWRLPAPDAYVGSPEHAWEVHWEPAAGRRGWDPDEIAVVVAWDSGGPRRGRLAAVLSDATVEVLTLCLPCPAPVATVSRDPAFSGRALSVAARGTQTVVTVRGAAAVRRLFPARPDSVRLVRRWPNAEERELAVPVWRLAR
jgi:hypothetical protein